MGSRGLYGWYLFAGGAVRSLFLSVNLGGVGMEKVKRMNKLQPVFDRPKFPVKWDYQESVNRVKGLIFKWKNLTEELFIELEIAREGLASPAEKAGTKVPGLKTWSDYCEDIGSSRQVVNRWLRNWNELKKGAELKLLPPDTCAISDLQGLIASGKKFRTIYADPPWKYSNQATRASTDNHYETLTPEEIVEIPIKELAEEQAHLHLWTTNAFLFDSKAIIEAWGFEYKSCFIWVKTQMGIGNYWRVSHEFLILGVKGGLRFMDNSQMSWAEIERREHSEKPDEIRQVIEKVSQPQRLELFGRKLFPGWIVWGNEIERNLFNKQHFDDI